MADVRIEDMHTDSTPAPAVEKESGSGLSWTDIALVGVSLAAIPFTGGLSAAGLGLLGLRFGATRLAGAMLARSGTTGNLLQRSFSLGATAPAGTTGRAVAGEAFKDGTAATASSALNAGKALFSSPVKHVGSDGIKRTVTNASGDVVREFSKARTATTIAGGLALNETDLVDGALGRLGMRTAESGVSVVGDVAGAVVNGAGRVATDVDNRYTGGQGQQLVNGAVDAVAGTVTPRTPSGATTGTQQEETVVETDANGQQRRVPRSQSQESQMQRLMNSVVDKMKDDPVAAGFAAAGAIYGMSKSNGMMDATWKVPLFAMMFGVIGKIFGPILAPFLGMAGTKLQDAFHSAQVPTAEKSAAPTGLQQAPAGPVADTTVRTANEESEFRQSANEVTTPRAPQGYRTAMLANGAPQYVPA